ncbi:MAG: Mrr restriction system protein [Parcubacteria group bacterium GW2011_GWA2_49_9]|nr:MAG: Mrr restriction system protein [Parcubacteria group bacterium GW2011_GWA2_49_9]
MSIPIQEEILLPLLNSVKDRAEHHINEIVDVLINHFSLSKEEQSLQYPSGNDNIFRNRVRFARARLARAGLLEHPRRGYIKISETGLTALKSSPSKIDTDFLNQLPEVLPNSSVKEKEAGNEIDNQNPSELLEYGYQSIRRSLAQDILEIVKKCSPYFFEKLVVELLLKMGYGGFADGAGEVVGQNGDGGIDGVIKEDKLGLDVIYIQAKRWEGVVGEPIIRNFVGSLVRKHANKGVILTTSRFTTEAKDYVTQIPHRVILIDGELLSQFLIDNDIGVSKITSYDVKKVDSDYFLED